MIAYLQGTVQKKFEKSIILVAGQVGYLVHLAGPVIEKINEKEEIELFIQTKVREDDISLYGFETIEQLELFKAVTNVSGIGPKIGLEILSADPAKIKSAIAGKDVAYLSKIPGIGKKTAERLIVELKNKVDWDIIENLHTEEEKDLNNDIITALSGLGYQRYEINRVLKKMPENITEVEEAITYFLRNV
ncbi:Holliday junction branch migration protein RuvA [Patescibacteria group bacterium]|nr:Holliday junction branch migration protein RuvA [Patescibacteria group bacterium]MBU1703328.1 Holliday junction branch migration protein RuvA [Patescibacteria group bacterium]MBU1953850.1 Holliday junction branch migration protein RuvA [Patescibacteria group bacterium]